MLSAGKLGKIKPVYKPSSVSRKSGRWPFIWTERHHPVHAIYPLLSLVGNLGFARRCGPHLGAYSILHRVGFTSSCCCQRDWGSLTPPFHPYPNKSGRFGFCCTFHIRISVKIRTPGVTRHPVLRCSDFPPQ